MTNKLYKDKEQIKEWLDEHFIKDYELVKDNKYGYIVNVYSTVNLWKKNLNYIKVKFNKVHGDFDCADNQLKNLMACPEEIHGSFFCDNNKINSLEYFPNKVHNRCYLLNNPELKNIQYIENFEDLYLLHRETINKKLNKKLEQEINIDNQIKNDKIKL